MTLNEQMGNVKRKANSRLRLIKKLASTSWGADKNTLRQTYLGYVRSTMEYSLALQTISSKSTQQSVDKVQNHALRFIAGALKSTPTNTCEIHTDIEPMRLRREAAVVETIERYKRQDKGHPNRQLVEAPRPPERIKKKSVISIADSLKEKYQLPEEREPVSLFDTIQPYVQRHVPVIKQQLTENVSKRDSDPLNLMNTALKTIDKYPDEWIHIYTDGSASEGTANAGYGSRIQFPDQTWEELFDSCGTFCSNYEAEAKAIETSLLLVSNVFTQNIKERSNIVFFSDAKSVLQALENDDSKDPVIRNLSWTLSDFIKTHDIDITLQWIPGHTNIPGNERADRLAKFGARCTQHITSASMKTAKQTIKLKKSAVWMKEWETSDKGRTIFEHMKTPNKKDNINLLNRNEQVTIFRLRSRHIPLNQHLTRIGAKTDAGCPLCPCPEETVTHHLFVCPALDDLRTEYLPQKPDTTNTLYGTTLQLRNTHKFFVMASSRRARAQ